PISSTPTRMTARIGKANANSTMALPRRSAHNPTGSRTAALSVFPMVSIELYIVTEHDLVGVFGLHRIIDLDIDRALIGIVAGGGAVVAGRPLADRLGQERLGELGNGDVALAAAQLSGLSAAVHDGDVEPAAGWPQRGLVAALASGVAADVGPAFFLRDS